MPTVAWGGQGRSRAEASRVDGRGLGLGLLDAADPSRQVGEPVGDMQQHMRDASSHLHDLHGSTPSSTQRMAWASVSPDATQAPSAL
jgi:hypothetical protein